MPPKDLLSAAIHGEKTSVLQRSTRHSKIAGDFGEQLTLYWLSKNWIECALVDHTGIDIIARVKGLDKPCGISVKSRTRSVGEEKSPTGIKTKEIEKILSACGSFGCVPYLSFIVDVRDHIYLFMLSLKHFEDVGSKGKVWFNLSMTKKSIQRYFDDPDMVSVRLDCCMTSQ